MIRSANLLITIVSVSVFLWSLGSSTRESSHALAPLESLTGRTWVCISWDGEKPKYRITIRRELILEGNAIREVMEKPEIGFRREGLVFGDVEHRLIRYLFVTNNGLLGRATVSWERGVIVSQTMANRCPR